MDSPRFFGSSSIKPLQHFDRSHGGTFDEQLVHTQFLFCGFCRKSFIQSHEIQRNRNYKVKLQTRPYQMPAYENGKRFTETNGPIDT
ncbi:hypothetical protein TNCT_627951 [Trichonephila clavata]|uniref:Uncharacterized protein n=1 Tax=Trichonephila clavata TaxID=2740835 RepID=A0A8X6G553_TRICU|nr:hypothetical protein TNCT_627951 [Trichonephila clavata]